MSIKQQYHRFIFDKNPQIGFWSNNSSELKKYLMGHQVEGKQIKLQEALNAFTHIIISPGRSTKRNSVISELWKANPKNFKHLLKEPKINQPAVQRDNLVSSTVSRPSLDATLPLLNAALDRGLEDIANFLWRNNSGRLTSHFTGVYGNTELNFVDREILFERCLSLKHLTICKELWESEKAGIKAYFCGNSVRDKDLQVMLKRLLTSTYSRTSDLFAKQVIGSIERLGVLESLAKKLEGTQHAKLPQYVALSQRIHQLKEQAASQRAVMSYDSRSRSCAYYDHDPYSALVEFQMMIHHIAVANHNYLLQQQLVRHQKVFLVNGPSPAPAPTSDVSGVSDLSKTGKPHRMTSPD